MNQLISVIKLVELRDQMIVGNKGQVFRSISQFLTWEDTGIDTEMENEKK